MCRYIETSWGKRGVRGGRRGGRGRGGREREKKSSQSSTFPKRNTCPKTHISSLPTFVESYFPFLLLFLLFLFLQHFHQSHSTTIPPKSSPKQSPNKDTISTIENIFSLMTFTLSAFLFLLLSLLQIPKKSFTHARSKTEKSPPFPFTAYYSLLRVVVVIYLHTQSQFSP